RAEPVTPAVPGTLAGARFREGGAYLITGGLGGLGLLFARYLGRRYGAKLVLSGRRGLDAELRERIRTVTEAGAEVMYVPADVASGSDVAALVAAARERFGSVNGVIHSAGTLRDGCVRGKSDRDFAAVLGANGEGTRHLAEA